MARASSRDGGGGGSGGGAAASPELARAIAAAAGLARDSAAAAARSSSSRQPPLPPQLARSLGQQITELTSAAVEAINGNDLDSALVILDALVEGPVAQLALPLVAGTTTGGGGGAEAAAFSSLNSSSALAIAATGTRVARGTARALSRDVEGAIDDFTAAIRLAPGYADSWKRRAQARAAMASGIGLLAAKQKKKTGGGGGSGDHEHEDGASRLRAKREELLDGALADLAQAARLLPRGPARADVLGERATIHRRRRDLRRAALDLQRAVDEADAADVSVNTGRNAPASNLVQDPLEPVVHARLWSSLGLARVGLGEIEEGVQAYERALTLLGEGDDENSLKKKASRGTTPPSLAEQQDAAEAAMARVEVLSHLMHAHKEAANAEECKRAYARCLRAATGSQVPAETAAPGGTGVGPSPATTRLFAQMLAGCGDLSAAIQETEASLGYRSAAASSATGRAAPAAAPAGSLSSSSSRKGAAKGGRTSPPTTAPTPATTARRPVELRPAARAESLVALAGFYHAAGRFGAAAAAYDEASRCAALASREKKKSGEPENGSGTSDDDDEGFSGDYDAEAGGVAAASAKTARVAAAAAFYQKECLLWLVERLDEPAATETCLDADLHPLFKEEWCKKSRPDAALLAASPQRPPMRLDIFVPPSQRGGGGGFGDGEGDGASSSSASSTIARGGQAGTSGRGGRCGPSLLVPDSPADPAFLAGRVDVPFPLTPDVIPASQLEALLSAADAVGSLMQYRQRGFLSNRRTRRAAGLAAIEAAQLLRRVAAAARGSCSSSSSSPSSGSGEVVVHPRGASHPSGTPRTCGWRDLADVAVRWRQLAEPGDQVIWVDRLSREEFEAGFGSHTPIFSGQTACVRYADNTGRALRLFAECAALAGGVKDAAGEDVPCPRGSARAAGISAARTPGELLGACGCDAWVAVPIEAVRTGGAGGGAAARSKKKSGGGSGDSGGESSSSPSSSTQQEQQQHRTTLDGTRLTVTEVAGVPGGVELSIRTPVTPARWASFSRELDAHFADLSEALARRDAPAARAAGLRLAYYWFNFMPLARGSAAVGLATLLAVGLACGVPATSGAPAGRQVDWEAILCRTPAGFARVVVPWLWPAESGSGSGGGGASGSGNGNGALSSSSPSSSTSAASTAASFDLGSLPQVSIVLRSFRARIAALNRGIVG